VIIIKKYFKYIGLIGICLLSFYYTEQVALYVKNKNPIMQSIRNVSESYSTESINCSIIEDIYIIPGYNGKYVNLDKSFYNMVTTEYNEELLVFNQIKPNISLENNKDKIIIRGNHNKQAVSLLFEDINSLSKYLSQNNYLVNILIEEETYTNKYELINNSKQEYTYKKIDNKLNNNLCYTRDDTIPKLCKNKYVFTHSLEINHSNLSKLINTISSGDIILIKDSINIEELDLIINQIKYKDLSIIPISKLISETST
jgi:hypothetical protein